MALSDQRAIAALAARVDALEAEGAVRRVLARYMHLCDQPCPDDRDPRLEDLFTADAVWEGVGAAYRDKFGLQRGRDAVVAFVSAYLAPQSDHFQFNSHLLTSEAIRVDGDQAWGQWIMQQISTYANGSSELILARLNIDFRRTRDQWAMSHFRTERLFSAPLKDAQHFCQSVQDADGDRS